MKKRFCLLLLIFITCLSPGPGQVFIKDLQDFPADLKSRIKADKHNKVIMEEGYYQMLLNRFQNQEYQSDSVGIMNGWPMIEEGGISCGGIFCNLDEDSDLELVYDFYHKVFAWNIDGSPVPGWPRDLEQSMSLYYTPAYGDIDGDGSGEVVVNVFLFPPGSGGKIYAFKSNGTPVTGFPVTCLNGGAMEAPVLSDIDQDGKLEIIITEDNDPAGYVNVYRFDGTVMPGWPKQMDYVPGSSVAVGDINNDGNPEIIAESYNSVYAYDATGNLLDGFPFTPGGNRHFSYSSPVLADLDDDGFREIIFGDHEVGSLHDGRVYVLKKDGSLMNGFPVTTGFLIYAPVTVANLDNNPGLEIIAGDAGGTLTPFLYAWKSNGENLPGFPVPINSSIDCQALVVDINNDNQLEIIIDNTMVYANYRAYKSDGTEYTANGWPLNVTGSTFWITPVINDVNGDYVFEMSGGADVYVPSGLDTAYIYLWNLEAGYSKSAIELNILQYNNRHTGVYGDFDTLYASLENRNRVYNNALHLYPDPVKESVNVSFVPPVTGTSGIIISDITGRNVLYFTAEVKEQIPVNAKLFPGKLREGIYFLRIIIGGQVISTGKFCKVPG